MGRKAEGDEKMGPGRYIRLPRDIQNELDAIAIEEDRPIGRVIRNVLRDGLVARGRLRPEKSKARRT